MNPLQLQLNIDMHEKEKREKKLNSIIFQLKYT